MRRKAPERDIELERVLLQCVKCVRVRGAYEVRREEGCVSSAEVQGALNELARPRQLPPLHGCMAVVGVEGARAWRV